MTLTRAMANACYTRDGFKCRHCGDRGGVQPHHIIYASHGGPDELWNLITLCAWNCHRAIHEGNLVIEKPANAYKEVKFTRLNNWKPK